MPEESPADREPILTGLWTLQPLTRFCAPKSGRWLTGRRRSIRRAIPPRSHRSCLRDAPSSSSVPGRASRGVHTNTDNGAGRRFRSDAPTRRAGAQGRSDTNRDVLTGNSPWRRNPPGPAQSEGRWGRSGRDPGASGARPVFFRRRERFPSGFLDFTRTLASRSRAADRPAELPPIRATRSDAE